MDSILEQQPQPTRSIADLLPREIKKPNARKDFADEVYAKLGGKWDRKFIGVMIGTVCPKGASDSFIHDIQKECQTAKNYSQRFWSLYNEAVGRKSKKVVK